MPGPQAPPRTSVVLANHSHNARASQLPSPLPMTTLTFTLYRLLIHVRSLFRFDFRAFDLVAQTQFTHYRVESDCKYLVQAARARLPTTRLSHLRNMFCLRSWIPVLFFLYIASFPSSPAHKLIIHADYGPTPRPSISSSSLARHTSLTGHVSTAPFFCLSSS